MLWIMRYISKHCVKSNLYFFKSKIPKLTRMHSSRMRTARSLTVSRSIFHAQPPSPPCHATPVAMHASLATHAPCHTCPCHAPPTIHAPTTHAPLSCMPPPLPCMPPCYACPLPCMSPCHACPLPYMPSAMHASLPYMPPPMDRILDTRFWRYYLALTSLRAVKIWRWL